MTTPSFSLTPSDPPADAGLSRQQLVTVFGIAVVVSIGLGMVSWGGNIIYPFRLLATWAHEMGHGLAAIVTGNSFRELELYSNLGGQALIAGADGVTQVIVSAGGLIGPSLLGAAVMIAGSRSRTAPYVLGALAGSMILSAFIWIRNPFGFFSILIGGVVLALAAKFAPAIARIALSQLLAVQLALASWSSRDYLFIKGFQRDGQFLDSDTQNIADEWFLPYWFWGGLIGALSVIILVWAFWVAWLRPLTKQDTATQTPA